MQGDRCEHGERLSSSTNSSVTITTMSDDTFIDDDAVAAVYSDESSIDDDNDRSSVVDEPPSRESSSSPTSDGLSSPIEAVFDRSNVTAGRLRQYIHTEAGDAVMFPQSDMKSW